MKKNYRKPTMKVVELHQQGMLMQSGVGASRDSYGTANEQSWDE